MPFEFSLPTGGRTLLNLRVDGSFAGPVAWVLDTPGVVLTSESTSSILVEAQGSATVAQFRLTVPYLPSGETIVQELTETIIVRVRKPVPNQTSDGLSISLERV